MAGKPAQGEGTVVYEISQRVKRADALQPGPAVHHSHGMQLAIKLYEFNQRGLPQRGGKVAHRDRRGRVCGPAVGLPTVMVTDLAFERGLAADQVGAGRPACRSSSSLATVTRRRASAAASSGSFGGRAGRDSK